MFKIFSKLVSFFNPTQTNDDFFKDLIEIQRKKQQRLEEEKKESARQTHLLDEKKKKESEIAEIKRRQYLLKELEKLPEVDTLLNRPTKELEALYEDMCLKQSIKLWLSSPKVMKVIKKGMMENAKKGVPEYDISHILRPKLGSLGLNMEKLTEKDLCTSPVCKHMLTSLREIFEKNGIQIVAISYIEGGTKTERREVHGEGKSEEVVLYSWPTRYSSICIKWK